MGKRKVMKAQPRRRRIGMVLAAVAVLVLAGGAYWWTAESPEPVGGTPRMVLDRKVIDFGTVPFDTTVKAVFTLTNEGDGVLRLADVPSVKVLAGC